jgi:pilus assembly protein Flp/PilA
MNRLRIFTRDLVRDDEGATMVEYALVVAVIALIVVVGAKVLGNSTSAKFNNVAGQLT